MNPLGARAAFLVEHLNLAEATGEPDARWEAYQIPMLSDEGLLSISRKARQIGWSWTAAADAVAAGILVPRTLSVFVSFNMSETKEKILYAKAVVEALDADVRPRVVNDNSTDVEFANGSRILSHPGKPVRGKARARIYLDEFAHYARDQAIYSSALPATTRGGCVRIASTPRGAGGMFWEVMTQRRQTYPGFARFYLPWWSVGALCTDPASAMAEAPSLTTAARVEKFGTPRLRVIFANMVLEDFQQEYECDWADESISFISWDEIKRAQAKNQAGELECLQARTLDEAMAAVETLVDLVVKGRMEAAFVGGLDIGRRHDLSELTLCGRTTTGELVTRLTAGLRGCPFDLQYDLCDRILRVLPVSKFCIDETGLGMMLAEKLKLAHWTRVEPITFTNSSKEIMAVETKVRFQRGDLHLPADRDLANQIHSIHKLVTPSKHVTFDVERTNKHHADRFWSLALACYAARGAVGSPLR